MPPWHIPHILHPFSEHMCRLPALMPSLAPIAAVSGGFAAALLMISRAVFAIAFCQPYIGTQQQLTGCFILCLLDIYQLLWFKSKCRKSKIDSGMIAQTCFRFFIASIEYPDSCNDWTGILSDLRGSKPFYRPERDLFVHSFSHMAHPTRSVTYFVSRVCSDGSFHWGHCFPMDVQSVTWMYIYLPFTP